MKRLILVAALLAGVGICRGTVFILFPGDSSFIGSAVGSGSAFIHWESDGEWDGTAFVAMFDFSGAPYAYIVQDASDRVVEDVFVDASPVHFTTSDRLLDFEVHCAFPSGYYYLATSWSEAARGEEIGVTAYESERFAVMVPETGHWIGIASLGLAAFGAFRRLRG